MRRVKTMQGGHVLMCASAVAALVTTAAPARADADTHPVRIDSEPPGATISLGEGEELGETPFEGSLPAGVYTLIFQHAGYETGVDVFEVRPSREPQSFSIELVAMRHGILDVSSAEGSPSLDGAEVWLDGDKLGDAPGKLEVPVGPHLVEIVKPGFETFEVWIEVSEGETVDLVATLEGDPDVVVNQEPVEAPVVMGPPLIRIGGGLEFGGRTFRYENPQTANLRPYNAGGVPLLRLGVELFPLSRTGNDWLTGLALVGAGAWAVPLDSSTEEGEVIGTTWSEYDVAARALFPIANTVRAGLEGGHGRARFNFEEAGALSDEVPDVDYRYARVGAVTSAGIGRYDLRGVASYVSPYEAGRTAERFEESNVWGMALAASVGSNFARHFDARLTAHYTRFAYSLDPEPDAAYQADGGVDHFLGVTLGGYFRY